MSLTGNARSKPYFKTVWSPPSYGPLDVDDRPAIFRFMLDEQGAAVGLMWHQEEARGKAAKTGLTGNETTAFWLAVFEYLSAMAELGTDARTAYLTAKHVPGSIWTDDFVGVGRRPPMTTWNVEQARLWLQGAPVSTDAWCGGLAVPDLPDRLSNRGRGCLRG